jgi:hypothetical protein
VSEAERERKAAGAPSTGGTSVLAVAEGDYVMVHGRFSGGEVAMRGRDAQA